MTQIFAPFQPACLAALKVLRSGFAYVHGQNEFFSRVLELYRDNMGPPLAANVWLGFKSACFASVSNT